MAQNISGNDTSDCVELVGFSVVLVANSNNPSILNPDFLRYNEIVDADLQVQGNPITTPAFSQVTFADGLTVKADPNRVIFEQTGDPLTRENVLCPEMANRYLEKVPHVPYSAVGINPKGYRVSPTAVPEKISTALRDMGTWMSFKDVHPEIHLKTIYKYESRMIVLEVIEARKRIKENVEVPGILFQANIHRDVPATNPQKRVEFVSTALASWKEDLSDFDTLVAKFTFRSIDS